MERAIKLLDNKIQNSFRILAAKQLKQLYNANLNNTIHLCTSEQSPGNPNPLLLQAIDPSQPLTWPWQSDTNLHTVHKTMHQLLGTTATTPT